MGAESEHTVPRRVFEALFASGVLELDERLREALRSEAGIDVERPVPRYGLAAWRRAVALARAHHFGDRAEADGYRELGRRFTEGFGRTTVGVVFRAVAPLFGPDRTILALQRYIHVVRDDMTVQITSVGVNRYLAVLTDSMPMPDFIAGAIEGILLALGCAPRVTVTQATAHGFELDIAWD